MRDTTPTSKKGKFEWSTAKGSNFKTRKWVPEGKAEAAPAAKAKPAATTKKASTVAKDPMKGYRKGDVTTTSLDKGGRGDGKSEMVVRRADAAIKRAAALSTKVAAKSSSSNSGASATAKPAKAPVFTKKTGPKASAELESRYKSMDTNPPAGLSFSDWKSKYAGKTWKPGEALSAYDKYKKRTKE